MCTGKTSLLGVCSESALLLHLEPTGIQAIECATHSACRCIGRGCIRRNSQKFTHFHHYQFAIPFQFSIGPALVFSFLFRLHSNSSHASEMRQFCFRIKQSNEMEYLMIDSGFSDGPWGPLDNLLK